MIPVQQRSRKRGTGRQTADDDVVVPRERRARRALFRAVAKDSSSRREQETEDSRERRGVSNRYSLHTGGKCRCLVVMVKSQFVVFRLLPIANAPNLRPSRP